MKNLFLINQQSTDKASMRRPLLLLMLLISVFIAFKLDTFNWWMNNDLAINFFESIEAYPSAIALLILCNLCMVIYALKLSKQLKQSDTDFKEMFERLNFPACLIRDRRLIDINQAALSILKFRDKKRLLYSDLIDISPEYQEDHEASAQKIEKIFETAQKKGKSHFAWLHKRNDDELIQVDASLISLNIKGLPSFLYGFLETTEQKRCEQSLRRCEEKMQCLFEDSSEAILFYRENAFFDGNMRALEIFGLNDIEELSTYSLCDLSAPFQADDSDSVEASHRQIQAGFDFGVHRFEWNFKKQNGDEFIGEVKLFFFSYDEEPALKICISDITQIKHIDYYKAYKSQIIEFIAKAAPLPEILEMLAKSVHLLDPAKRAAILIVDDNSQLLLLAAAPDLPDFFDPSLCPFSYEAMETQQRILIEDVREFIDGDWIQQPLAVQAGIGALWAEPIQALNGSVLGVFITYHRDAGIPSDTDLELSLQNANLAALAIDRCKTAETLQDAVLFINTAIKRWK